MSQQMQPVPASQQVQQLAQQLNQAFNAREEAQAAVDRANEQIKAIRNVMTGVGIGQKLQQEIAAEQAKTEPPKQ